MLKVTTIFFDEQKLEFMWQNGLSGLVLISLHSSVNLCIRSWEDKTQCMAILGAVESSAKALKQQSLLQPRVNYTSLTG